MATFIAGLPPEKQVGTERLEVYKCPFGEHFHWGHRKVGT